MLTTARSRGWGNDLTGLVRREHVPDYLAAATSLVTLKRSNLFKTVLPSKMFEAMAARACAAGGRRPGNPRHPPR